MGSKYLQAGHSLPLTCPVGGVVVDQPYVIGDMLVIALGSVSAADALLGVKFEGQLEGVMLLPKLAQEAWTEGEKIYFDDDSGSSPPVPVFTNAAGSPALPLVGFAAAAVPLSLILADNAGGSPPDWALDADLGTIQSINYAGMTGTTFTITINGVAHVLTEGADWFSTASPTSDDLTAASLGAALAALPGITVEVVTDTITVTVTNPSTTGPVRLDGVAR